MEEAKDVVLPVAVSEPEVSYAERATTLDALEDIRVSYTKPSLLEQEQQQRLHAAEEKLRLLREKPRRRTRAQKLRERIKKNSITKIPENQKPVPHYIARILTDEPLVTKDFEEMKREGADSYHLQQSQKFYSRQGKNIGIPRAIYTDLLSAVVMEEETKIERRAARQREKEKLTSRDTLDITLSRKGSKSGKGSKKVKRPQTAGSKRTSDDGDASTMPVLTKAKEASAAADLAKTKTAVMEEEEIPSLLGSKLGRDRLDPMRSFGAKAGGLPAAQSSMMSLPSPRKVSDTVDGSISTNRRSLDSIGIAADKTKKELDHKMNNKEKMFKKPGFVSTWGRPTQKSPQRLKREQLLKDRDEAILKRVQDMEKRHRREAILKDLQSRQYAWLFVVSHLSRMQLWRNKYMNEIKPMREKEMKERDANVKRHAVALISGWWFFCRVSLRMKLNMNAVAILKVAVRRIWAKIQIRKRHRGSRQVVRFLRDCAGSDKVKRMYTYRTKIIKIQRWFRMWYNLQEQRMQTLWRAMELIGKKRVENAQRDARIAERLALKAMSEAAGFANTLNHINMTAMKIDGYLSVKEKEAKQRAEAEAIRSALKEASKKKAETGKYVAKNKSGGRRTLQKATSSSDIGGTGIRWMRRTYVNPATRKNFVALRDLLEKERTRHILAVTESEKRHTKRKAGGRLPEVNFDALKEFLTADPKDVDENFDLFEDEEDEDGKDKAKDKKPQHKRHKNKGKFQAHPLFLLFSQGALEFLHRVELNFFKGILPGFDHDLIV